jgi:hypothetical protein
VSVHVGVSHGGALASLVFKQLYLGSSKSSVHEERLVLTVGSPQELNLLLNCALS